MNKKTTKVKEETPKPKTVYRTNPDPFEMRVRRQGLTPAAKTYTGNEPSESFYFQSESEKSVGYRGNQVMSKGSAYTNLLRTYTDYQQNERFKKSKISAEEREEKRNKRFKHFKRIKVNSIRDYVMKSRVRSTGSLFIIIPTFLSVIAGISHYATINFGIYLKYQGMVDMYYDKTTEETEGKETEIQNNFVPKNTA